MPEYIVSKVGGTPSGCIYNSMDEAIEAKRYVEERWGHHEILVRTFGKWHPVDHDQEWAYA